MGRMLTLARWPVMHATLALAIAGTTSAAVQKVFE